MKTVPLLLFAICCACSLLDTEIPLGTPREFEQHPVRRPVQDDTTAAIHVPDTTFYVSAVTFPPAYDWQRDTAFGATACTLKLYRGPELLLSVPAGPAHRISASPDRSHLIGNQLITVYSDHLGTTIKNGGAKLADWPEKEKVTGILIKNGTLHTTGLDPSGRWFTYRRNGEVVLKIDNASVFGDFNRSGYGPGGAIYEDMDRVCFAYKTSEGAAYMVMDGNPELLMSSPSVSYLDVKQVGGRIAMLYNDGGNARLTYDGTSYGVDSGGALQWDFGEVIVSGTEPPAVLGYYRWTGTTMEGLGLWDPHMMWCFRDGYDYFYPTEWIWDSFYFRLPRPGWEDCYFFNRSCACLAGHDLAAVLTPRDGGQSPFLAFRKDTLRYNIHGFLSGVSVQTGD